MNSDSFNKVFSNRLRYYLNLHNITQVELAKKLGVGASSVHNWCAGIKAPRVDKIDKMCEIFGCKRSDLVEYVHEVTTDEYAYVSKELIKDNDMVFALKKYFSLTPEAKRNIVYMINHMVEPD